MADDHTTLSNQLLGAVRLINNVHDRQAHVVESRTESEFYNADVVQQGDDRTAAAALAADYCADVPNGCSDGVGRPTGWTSSRGYGAVTSSVRFPSS